LDYLKMGMVLLCERHSKDKDKLPLIMPIVVYNGKEKYTAAKDLWQLFTDPVMAKQLLTNEYKLIDLQAMSDDEIIARKHLGMMEFFMKHIHQKNMINLWKDFFRKASWQMLIEDKKSGYIYIKPLMWYTEAKVSEDEQEELMDLITESLIEDGGSVVRTIAEKYILEGIEQGIEKGIEQGIERGMWMVVESMLRKNISPNDVAEYTGLPLAEVVNLKNSMMMSA
jgi:predicted transposase/invertase (TIGR01784 family)